MNANQISERGAAESVPDGANGFASAILQNFFSKKTAMSDEKISESVSSPATAERSENTETVSQILSRLENKKEQAAVNLGIGAEEVETMPFDLSQLETEGIFLNIDCSGFGALQRQLDWKTLGVELPAETAVSVSPPRAGLLPDSYRKKLLRGAAQAHNALNRYSFRFTLCETVWGTSEYKWIPWNAFESFESEYKQACETLSRAKAEVLANYDGILITLRASFTKLAGDSAQRLEATNTTPFDRAEFVANVVARAMGMIPTTDMIRDGMTISMKPKVIVLGSEMLAEQKRSRELNLETTRIEAERQAVRVELETKTRIEQMKLVEFERDQRREQEVKERIRQMKIEAAQKEAAEAVSPIREGLNQITAKIYEAAEEMAAKMQTADFVPGSLAKRARQMCEWYALMNFTQDKSLEEVLQRLQTAAAQDAKLRSPAEMQAALNDVLRGTSIKTKRLLEEDRLSALEL